MAVSEIKRQEKYEMKIYADNVISTDERFTMDNLNAGNNYKTLSAVFVNCAHFTGAKRKKDTE